MRCTFCSSRHTSLRITRRRACCLRPERQQGEDGQSCGAQVPFAMAVSQTIFRSGTRLHFDQELASNSLEDFIYAPCLQEVHCVELHAVQYAPHIVGLLHATHARLAADKDVRESGTEASVFRGAGREVRS